MDALTEKAQALVPWTFIYADDVAICTTSQSELEHALNEWKRQLQAGGLMLSVAKTQYMVCNNPGASEDPLVIDGQQIKKCDEYKYLGTMLHTTGDLEANIQHRIAAAWLKWREVTGVTCDRRMPEMF
ncbi:reverse transcriptase (RNA-dependent DNA polymerase) domain-containing protein [Phthorimaea operculella]|nr:reverse transcriptase (RNA-dependent DNA polymerase) domain-containing protein [Phthorimaea operculella]